MNAFDSQAEDSPTSLGRSLRRRPLARKKLSEMVEEELEQMIRRHEFGEGEQLPSERELMAFFNVGRPSVREALAALKRKGLVQIKNSYGFSLNPAWYAMRRNMLPTSRSRC